MEVWPLLSIWEQVDGPLRRGESTYFLYFYSCVTTLLLDEPSITAKLFEAAPASGCKQNWQHCCRQYPLAAW